MRDLTLSLPLGLSKRKSVSLNSTQKINIALAGLVVLLGFGYLFQINALGTKGYEIKKVEQKIQALEEQQKTLQLESSDLQSIEKIQLQSAAANFVPSNNVTYIKDGNFALK